MSASEAPALDAVAFQLAAALDAYEASVSRMMDTWLDMELYRSVSEQVEEIRMHTAALPQLSVPWVELLIAHAELVHMLWRSSYEPRAGSLPEELRAVRERHAACVAMLRSRCLRLISTRA